MALLAGAARGRAEVAFAVDTTVDAPDASPGDGLCRTSGGRCSLRAAFMEASSSPTLAMPVTISVPAGTYRLTLSPPEPGRGDDAGDLDLFTHAAGSMDVSVTGAGAGRTIVVQTVPGERVVEVGGRGRVRISNLALRGARGPSLQGGGIDSTLDGYLTLRGVEVADNQGDVGGGIASSGHLTLEQSVVSGNSASGSGGGIWLTATSARIFRSTVSGNRATIAGGGIWFQNGERLEISHSLIADNAVTGPLTAPAAGGGTVEVPPLGGGIRVSTETGLSAPTATVAYSTIRGNAAGAGGGIQWDAAGSLTIEGSLLASNTAERGGALDLHDEGRGLVNSLAVINSTLHGNAAERGGALFRTVNPCEASPACEPERTAFRAATIAGNTAPAGSGFFFNGVRETYAVASGTIVANEPAAENCAGAPDLFGRGAHLSSPGTNIESGDGCGLTGSDRSGVDPLLGPLADNGGSTQTRAPAADSPAVDGYTEGDCPALDQRHYGRPAGADCDVGAFERGAAVVPSVTLPPIRPFGHVDGGRLILVPVPLGPVTATSLRGGGLRPCAPGGKRLRLSVAAGHLGVRDAELVSHGTLVFRRDAKRQVRLGNLLVALDGRRGRVLALLAPVDGPLPVFAVEQVTYGKRAVRGRLVLTARAAKLLRARLGLPGFRAGMGCGRIQLALEVGKKPPPLPVVEPPPPGSVTLRVAAEPGGTGSVTSAPGGISCPTDCSEAYPAGTEVALTAAPSDGFELDRWEGACSGSGSCTVTLDTEKSVTAEFRSTAPSQTPSPPPTEPSPPEPSPPSTPQCSDGKDNDGDGAIDLQDPQCSSPTDDSESS